MTGTNSQPRFDELSWAELLIALVEEQGELKKTDGTCVAPCPFSPEKICRVEEQTDSEKVNYSFTCVEPLVRKEDPPIQLEETDCGPLTT